MQMKTGIAAMLLAAALGGCGGGDTPVATCGTTKGVPDACPTPTATGAVSVTAPTLHLSLTDAAGAIQTEISPDRPGTLRAVVKDGDGAVVQNAAVTFTTNDKTGVFLPSSGTALTDSGGVAQVHLPVGTQAGAFTATASAMVGNTAVSGTTSYAVTFPTLTVGLSATPATFSAGGTTNLNVTLMNGSSPFTAAQSVSLTSPCAAAGKATISSPVIALNGAASTSYTDKGCGGPDTITASTTLGGATYTQTRTVTALAAAAGQIAFIGASPKNIALKGTGGPGRQESSTVTFKVLDSSGNPVAGAQVNFFVFSNTGTTLGTGG